MIKTALVGLGRIGWQFHLPQIKQHDQYALAAVVDVDESRLAQAQAAYHVRGYTSVEAMLKAESPQLVVIASPTTYHRPQAIACMRAGADVLLDKPMAESYEAACDIAEAARRLGRKLTVYQPHRFMEEAVAAKRIIQSGKLGAIFQIKRVVDRYVCRDDWQAYAAYGGGMLNNYGAHYIDQLLYLLDEEESGVFCHMNRIASLGDAEDVVRVMLRTDSHALLDIDINQAAALCGEPLMIYGKYGAAKLEAAPDGRWQYRLRYFDPAQVKRREIGQENLLAAKDRKYPSTDLPWQEEVQAVRAEDAVDYYEACAAYFAGEKDAPVALRDTLRVMRIIRDCRADAESEGCLC